MVEEVEKVEKGRVSSTRKLIKIGHSMAVTLPKTWLDIQKWLGEELTELYVLANDVVILTRPERKEIAEKVLTMVEKESEGG